MYSFRDADAYQYQLQALWQKAWATGQGVMQNLRFRERGPFKTWRPETMAEAIMAVLREGLSLSQVKNLHRFACQRHLPADNDPNVH